MKLLNYIILVAAIFILQFLIIPLTGLGINIFIPFALVYFSFENKVSRVLAASIVLDVFMGLPFPLMTVALGLTLAFVMIVYSLFSVDGLILKLAIYLPITLFIYWVFVYISALFLGFFWERLSIPFSVIFSTDLIFSIIYGVLFGFGFYIVINYLIPQGLTYDREGLHSIHT